MDPGVPLSPYEFYVLFRVAFTILWMMWVELTEYRGPLMPNQPVDEGNWERDDYWG